MSDNFKKKLDRVFLGNTPSHLLGFDFSIMHTALQNQGVEYADGGPIPDLIGINYPILIQDLYDLMKDKSSEPIDISQYEQMKIDFGTMLRSLHLETIQDLNRNTGEKLSITFFYRNILSAFHRIYNIELINNQAVFVNEMYQLEDYYMRVMSEEIEAIKKSQQANTPQQTQFELSKEWTFGVNKLHELSTCLWQAKFTESKDSLFQVFDANNESKCNWLSSRNALLYLLWSIFDGGSEKPTQLTLSLCVNRFLVKGKPTDKRIAQSTSIKNETDKSPSELKGKFEILHDIVSSIKLQ